MQKVDQRLHKPCAPSNHALLLLGPLFGCFFVACAACSCSIGGVPLGGGGGRPPRRQLPRAPRPGSQSHRARQAGGVFGHLLLPKSGPGEMDGFGMDGFIGMGAGRKSKATARSRMEGDFFHYTRALTNALRIRWLFQACHPSFRGLVYVFFGVMCLVSCGFVFVFSTRRCSARRGALASPSPSTSRPSPPPRPSKPSSPSSVKGKARPPPLPPRTRPLVGSTCTARTRLVRRRRLWAPWRWCKGRWRPWRRRAKAPSRCGRNGSRRA